MEIRSVFVNSAWTIWKKRRERQSLYDDWTKWSKTKTHSVIWSYVFVPSIIWDIFWFWNLFSMLTFLFTKDDQKIGNQQTTYSVFDAWSCSAVAGPWLEPLYLKLHSFQAPALGSELLTRRLSRLTVVGKLPAWSGTWHGQVLALKYRNK